MPLRLGQLAILCIAQLRRGAWRATRTRTVHGHTTMTAGMQHVCIMQRDGSRGATYNSMQQAWQPQRGYCHLPTVPVLYGTSRCAHSVTAGAVGQRHREAAAPPRYGPLRGLGCSGVVSRPLRKPYAACCHVLPARSLCCNSAALPCRCNRVALWCNRVALWCNRVALWCNRAVR